MADTHVKHHDYHLVNPSPWPLIASAAALITAIGGIAWMRTHVDGEGVLGIKGWYLFAIGFTALVATAWAWWLDIIREANEGYQTPVVQLHLRYGMIMFIASEAMFFVAWFWAYFDSALFPAGSCGRQGADRAAAAGNGDQSRCMRAPALRSAPP